MIQTNKTKMRFQREEKEIIKNREMLLAKMSQVESHCQKLISNTRIDVEDMVAKQSSVTEDLEVILQMNFHNFLQ